MIWPFSRKLSAALFPRKRVKVHGVIFTIQKIEPLHHVAGLKVLRKAYDTYRSGTPGAEDETANLKALRLHYIDTFMAGVVEPKLTRKAEDGRTAIFVENLFTDWSLAAELYEAIMAFTYPKKKVLSLSRLRASA